MKSQNLDCHNNGAIRSNLPILTLGVFATIAWSYLCSHSQGYGQVGAYQLWGVSAIVAFCSIAVCWIYRSDFSNINVNLVIVFALIFRIIGIFTFPVLEDDFYRFMWDGHQFASLGTPYAQAPSAFFGNELPSLFEEILDSINYPDSPTIYGPTNQWLFYLAHQLAPGQLWPIKLFVLIADITILFLVMRKIHPVALILYAWSPLLLKEFAISVHPDIWGCLLMVLALKAYSFKHDYLVGALIALAMGVKLFAVVILPFLFLWRWRAWFGFLSTALLISLPFGIRNAWLPDGLATMTSDWLFNAPLYELLGSFMSINHVKVLLISLFFLIAGIYGCTWLYRSIITIENDERPIPRGDLLFALLFLCLPAFNPWYAIWLIPFALQWPRLWVWVASLSLFLSYATGINLDQAELANYQHPPWVLIIEFGIIALVIFLEKWLKLIRN